MPTTLTLIKDVKEQNSLFSNPNLNVLFNGTENIMFSLKDTKALNDKENSYVIIAKITPGNVPVKPIPLNPITIRDRFRKKIGLVKYL